MRQDRVLIFATSRVKSNALDHAPIIPLCLSFHHLIFHFLTTYFGDTAAMSHILHAPTILPSGFAKATGGLC